MNRQCHRRARLTLMALAACVCAQAVAAPAPGGLILDHVTVVDTRTGKLTPDRAVVIDGGRGAILAGGSVSATSTARRVDARGTYVVPGFNDMHAHPLGAGDVGRALRLMLSEGITGYRQMNGSPEMLAARAAHQLPTADAPEPLAMPGTILGGPVAATPALAVAAVDAEKQQGADFIKYVGSPPPAFFAALAEAHKQGLTLVGHLPPEIDVRAASKAGMRAIEHLGPREAILLGCSTREAELRAEVRSLEASEAAGRGHARAEGPPPPALMERILANPIAFTNPATFPHYVRVLDSYDDGRCRELAGEFVRNTTWQVPTLIRLRTMELGDDPIYLNDPNLKYMPKATRALWLSVAHQYTATIPASARPELARLYKAQLALTKLFYDTGVPMLAGSDYGGGFVVPGFGLHEEFDELAAAGLPPLAILQMTTLNGARFLHREATMGTVEPGKVADLVLLDGDPVASAANLHRIHAVVRAGRLYTAADLDALRRKTEQAQQ